MMIKTQKPFSKDEDKLLQKVITFYK